MRAYESRVSLVVVVVVRACGTHLILGFHTPHALPRPGGTGSPARHPHAEYGPCTGSPTLGLSNVLKEKGAIIIGREELQEEKEEGSEEEGEE